MESGCAAGLDLKRDDNIVLMPSRYTLLRYSLNIRVSLIYLALATVVGALAIGGGKMLWLFGYFISIAFMVSLVRRSLKRKLKSRLAKESWNQAKGKSLEIYCKFFIHQERRINLPIQRNLYNL
jgi:hypothetical protein